MLYTEAASLYLACGVDAPQKKLGKIKLSFLQSSRRHNKLVVFSRREEIFALRDSFMVQ